MKKAVLSLILCIVILAAALTVVNAKSYVVTLSASTDNSVYDNYTPVTFSGSIDYYDYVTHQHPSDGLVALEIQDPSGAPVIIRTLRTGAGMPNSQIATIDAAYLCDTGDNQKTSTPMPTANNGVVPYYYIRVINNGATDLSMLLSITIFDSNGVPISIDYQRTPLVLAHSSFVEGRTNFIIPSSAHYGTAYACVDVLSDLPSNGGVPYGLEQSFQFTITGAPAFSGTPTTTSSLNGNYQFSYRVPKDAAPGTYTIYTTSNYLGTTSSKSTTFQVKLFGDLDNNNALNFKDVTMFVTYYMAYYSSSHTYTQAIDFNGDSKINFNDVTIFVHYYMIYWSS